MASDRTAARAPERKAPATDADANRDRRCSTASAPATTDRTRTRARSDFVVADELLAALGRLLPGGAAGLLLFLFLLGGLALLLLHRHGHGAQARRSGIEARERAHARALQEAL